MTPKHTPKPWKASKNYDNFFYSYTIDGGGKTLQETVANFGIAMVDSLQDARLIAVAPELLEFTRQIAYWLDSPDLTKRLQNLDAEEARALIKRAVELLNKAELGDIL